MRQWRLLYDQPLPGARNMAVDEALLRAVGRGDSPPVLRFYAWEPWCLSLGYGQPDIDVDWDSLHAQGWQAVRRPTGGRAILHADELTYSLILPGDHPLAAGNVVESYRRLSEALLAGLHQLGVQPQALPMVEAHHNGPVCFETPSHYEITAGGRKLVGSAQLRRAGAVLQHGSLPLGGDPATICLALAFPDAAAREAAMARVRERATTLAAVVGQAVSFASTANAIQRGFESVFGITLQADQLAAGEADDAARLCETVYSRIDWTRHA